MSNKKLILGVAAGVAALAVVGVICKKKGYFDNISTGEFGTNLKNKISDLKDSAKQKYDELTGHQSETVSSTVKSATNTGNAGANPATA